MCKSSVACKIIIPVLMCSFCRDIMEKNIVSAPCSNSRAGNARMKNCGVECENM